MAVPRYIFARHCPAACTEDGAGRYTWNITDYGTVTFDVSVPQTGHDYAASATAPTCTAQGYTTHTCSRCSDSYVDNYVNGICSICGEKDPTYVPPVTFSDVPNGAYFADAVNWAVTNGITNGTGDGKFSPDATCTRAQIVTFLYRDLA